MTGGLKVIILGIVMCIIAVIVCIASLFIAIKDPAVEARATVTFVSADYEETAYLPNGDYDIWYLVTSWWDTGPGDLTIEDQYGTVVYETPVSYVSETITVNNREYKKIGSFTLQSSGNYNITVEESDYILYFTPPINILEGLVICFGGVGIGIFGGVLILVGLILHLGQKKKAAPQYPPQYSPQQYPPQYPSQYPPQQGPPMPPT